MVTSLASWASEPGTSAGDMDMNACTVSTASAPVLFDLELHHNPVSLLMLWE